MASPVAIPADVTTACNVSSTYLLVDLADKLVLLARLEALLSQLGALLLDLQRTELLAQAAGSPQPGKHNHSQNDSQVWCGGSQATKAHDHGLLDESTSRLAQWIADHINGGLALQLCLLVQRDVGHLLAGVKEGILG